MKKTKSVPERADRLQLKLYNETNYKLMKSGVPHG